MHSPSFLLFNKAHKINNPEFWELNAFLAIRALAIGLSDIFLPIYLYYNGLSLKTIFLFYVVLNIFNLILIPFCAVLITTIGSKYTIVLNAFFQIIFYLLIFSFTAFHWNIYLLAFCLSLAHTSFRQGLHIQIIDNTHSKNQGKSLSVLTIFQILAKAISPMVGGFIVYFFSYNVVLVISSLLIMVSILPLLFTRDTHQALTYNFRAVFKNMRWNEFWSLFGAGIENDTNQLIWPIILVIFLNNSFQTTGIITSLGIGFSVLSAYVIGKYSDTKRNWLLWAGVIGGSIFWALRSIITTGWHIFLIDSAFGFTSTLKTIPYDTKIYDRFRVNNTMQYMIFHQTAVNLGRLALFIILFIFPHPTSFLWLAAGGGLLHLIF